MDGEVLLLDAIKYLLRCVWLREVVAKYKRLNGVLLYQFSFECVELIFAASDQNKVVAFGGEKFCEG